MRGLFVDLEVRSDLGEFQVRDAVVLHATPLMHTTGRELTIRVPVNHTRPAVLMPSQPESVIRRHRTSTEHSCRPREWQRL